ncbi:MAG: hypothetical protein M0R03_14840 [Novosphingobium sp.]|nr:hypothetical protein [Novosphingobium sp.]
MSENNVTVYSAEEVDLIAAKAAETAAYTSRIGTVLMTVLDELVKSGAAPVVINTIYDIMADYGLIQQAPPQDQQSGEEMKTNEVAAAQ